MFRMYFDHKALENITKAYDSEHNARVQRWLEFLSTYSYTLEYHKGSANDSADAPASINQPPTSSTLHPAA